MFFNPQQNIKIFESRGISLRFIWLIISLNCFIYSPCVIAQPTELTVIGTVFKYRVQSGDYLIKIGARYGVEATSLSRSNYIAYNGILLPGQELVIDNRHIVPYKTENGLLINLPQRILYFFQGGNLTVAYPIGLGKPSWPTPIGEFIVVDKAINKPWLVPKSIQVEMKREGHLVKEKVPPGSNNPLGKHWIGLSLSAIGIHGTIAPSSVYDFRSHGCIRLHPDDIAELFEKIPIGVVGNIIYLPILLAESDGKIFLEVHQDIYNKSSSAMLDVGKMAHDRRLFERIDWIKAERVFQLKEGIASDISLPVRKHLKID